MEDQQQQQQQEDDFSFPSILGNSPCSIDSPPWLYSPSNPTILQGRQDQDEDDDVDSKIREFEAPEKNDKAVGVAVDTTIRDGSREEKMDMLWEDFNEDLWGSSMTTEKLHSSSGKVTKGKGSNKGGVAVSSPAKRPGAVAFVKALRKLFLLRGDASSVPVPGPGPIKTQRRGSQR